MRLVTRPPLVGFAFSLCICLLFSPVLVSVFLAPPADAQTYMPYWDPDTVEVLESEPEVVLTLRKSGPGHVRYQTEDGDCATGTLVETTPRCSPPGARAPDDYGAVNGHEIFSTGGSEFKTIRIPIVDDDLDEGSEAFSVFAHEGDRSSGWTGDVGTVWILDDDRSTNSSGTTAVSGRSNQQPAASRTGLPAPPAGGPTTTPAPSELTVAGNQPGTVNPSDPVFQVEASTGEKADPVGTAASEERQTSRLPIAGAGILLLVAIAAGSLLTMRFHAGRR